MEVEYDLGSPGGERAVLALALRFGEKVGSEDTTDAGILSACEFVLTGAACAPAPTEDTDSCVILELSPACDDSLGDRSLSLFPSRGALIVDRSPIAL